MTTRLSCPTSAESSKELHQQAEGQKPRPPWLLIAAIVVFNVVGKVGDAVGPAIVGNRPLQLLLLNSSNTHCILTSTTVGFWPWLIVTVLRRVCEDPLYFFIGWSYRTVALDLLREWSPDAADGFDKAEKMFRNNLYAAVALNPGATVCGLAGASRMAPWTFFALNIGSTTAQLLLMRAVCSKFPDQLDYVLELIQTNMCILLAIMVAITLFGALPLLRKQKPGALAKEHEE